MLPQLHAFGTDKPSRADLRIKFRALFTKKVPIITFNEADFHAFPLFRLGFVTFLTQIVAHSLLGVVAQRKDTASQDVLPQSPEEIGLVFLFIITGNNIDVPVPFFQPGIMSGGYPIAAQFVSPFYQHPELK